VSAPAWQISNRGLLGVDRVFWRSPVYDYLRPAGAEPCLYGVN